MIHILDMAVNQLFCSSFPDVELVHQIQVREIIQKNDVLYWGNGKTDKLLVFINSAKQKDGILGENGGIKICALYST